MDDLEPLVETIFGQVKSQGLFDQIRRECLADVDTTPAYQNLRQRVDTAVSKFLSNQKWSPDTNKNHLREKLRKNIIEMNFLDTGVQRIVDQVVNPKTSAFTSKIEDMVYTHVGVEKPKVEILEPPGISQLTLECIPPSRSGAPDDKEESADLLPTDLEAVSPDSERSSDRKSDVDMKDEEEKVEIKTEMDDEVSPPFEPIRVEEKPPLPEALIKTESQESTISGLTSQDSIESDHCRSNHQNTIAVVTTSSPATPPVPKGPTLKCETEPRESESPDQTETVKEETQLSQLSSDTQNSLIIAEHQSVSNEEPLKMDISEEAQMPIEFQEPEKSEVLTSFDLNKEAFKFEQAKRDVEPPPAPVNDSIPATTSDASNEVAETDSQPSAEAPAAISPPPPPPPPEEEKPAEPQAALVNSICPSGEVNKILVRATVAEDLEESLLDSGDSMDLKIVESDSRGSVSNETRDSKKQDEGSQSSSHRRSHHDHHRSSSSSTSHQHRSGSHKSSRDRDKERSRRRSRDHHKSDRKSDRSSSSKKENDRKRDKEKSSGKDSACRERNEKQRRSTDRDSNDGSGNNVSSSQKSTTTGATHGAEKSSNIQKAKSSPQSRSQGSGNKAKDQKKAGALQSPTTTSTSTTTSALADSSTSTTDRVQKPIVVDQLLDGNELNFQMLAGTPARGPETGRHSPSSSTPDAVVVVKKPKIAANFKEALKLSKVRKMMDLDKAKAAERAAVALNKGYGEPLSPDEDGEGSLLYFPEPESSSKFGMSATEAWWRQTKEQNTNPKLIEQVKRFFDGIETYKRPVPKACPERDGPVPKKGRAMDENKLTEAKKSVNGMSVQMISVADAMDMEVDDYQEVEVDLDDLTSMSTTENNNVQKENKNYGLVFNKLVNGDAELELTAGTVAPPKEVERRNRGPKPPVNQTQRYTSDDLYKPRPAIGRSRRSRALDGGEPEGSR